jgi:predicted nuclease of predicted toxin-antitoxin system
VKLLLDEHHSPRVASQLGKDGYDVVAASERDETRNIEDSDLLAYATTDGRAVVTENASDFVPLAVRWAAEGRTHAGIILTRPTTFTRARSSYPGTLIVALREFLREPPVTGDSWVWWL